MEPREWRHPFLCDCCVNSLLMFARLTFRAKKWIRPCGQSVPVQISDVALTSVLLRHKAWRASLLYQDICALNYQNSRDFMKASKVCCCWMLNTCCGFWCEQILIELETALLDDKPHWYPLQTHDVSSIPLPQPSPYLPRRHTHVDAPGKKLQRKSDLNSRPMWVSLFSPPPPLHLHLEMCLNVCVLGLYMCMCVCVYNCLGSQRLSEPEFDEGTAIVPKGGWGSFLCLPRTRLIFVVLFCGNICGQDCLCVILH